MLEYTRLNFIRPQESDNYRLKSDFVVKRLNKFFRSQIKKKSNQIIIDTNLKMGLPLENINKIAGPMVEAWAYEALLGEYENQHDDKRLLSVEKQERTDIADLVLEIKRGFETLFVNVDVKSTSNDILTAGKAPNITSFSRIRTAYTKDPDFMFIILSLKYNVRTEKRKKKYTRTIIEIDSVHVHDLKFVEEDCLTYNPALGTGQIQMKSIHDIRFFERTSEEMCEMLDRLYLASPSKSLDDLIFEGDRQGWFVDKQIKIAS